MLLPIAQLGQPILRQRTAEISPEDIRSAEFQQLLRDMYETLREAEGAGLAAPQVFSSRRVFLAAILPPAEEEQPPEVEFFINPHIVEASADATSSWEGCLSFPELLVKVTRPRAVTVEYLNGFGQAMRASLRDFPARVVQHELDHLDGILTLDRAASAADIIKASEIDVLKRPPE